MNEFDLKAAEWDDNPMHWQRSEAIASGILKSVPVNPSWTALEFGAGTGITSFLLKNHLKEIIMMDSSQEMVKVMQRKITDKRTANLKPVLHDLSREEWEEWKGRKFDLIFTQMTLHHIENTKLILTRFKSLLKNGGYLAVADLYPEDGSFHGKGFTGHRGFDPSELSLNLEYAGFDSIKFEPVFTIKKEISDNEIKQFDVFLMTAVSKIKEG